MATGLHPLHLYGEVQKEVVEARLRREFRVQAIFEEIKPAYFERPIGIGEATTEFDPHSHSEEFWATIGLRVEPTEFGEGVTFNREVKWGTMPQAFHRAIEDMVFHTLKQGLFGWPVTDCVVTLIRVGFNAPTSVAADFRNLTPLVLMRAMRAAGTQVYEPYHSIEVEVPSDRIGTLVGHLASLGGDITQSSSNGTFGLIIGELPARLIQKLTLALPELSSGHGVIWSRPGPDRSVRGAIPIQERMDGNPLNYDEYMRFLAHRKKW